MADTGDTDDDRTALAAEFVSRCRTDDDAYRLTLCREDGDPIDVAVEREHLGSVLGLRTGSVYRFDGLRVLRGTAPDSATDALGTGTARESPDVGDPTGHLVADGETRVGRV